MRSEAVAVDLVFEVDVDVDVDVEFRVKRCRKNGARNGSEVGLV